MGASKKKQSSRNSASATGPIKKRASNFVDRRRFPAHPGEDTEPQTSEGHESKSTTTAHGQGAHREPARESSLLQNTSPERSRVAIRTAANAHEYSPQSSRSGNHSEMQAPNITGQRYNQRPVRPLENARRPEFDDLTISEPGRRRSDHGEASHGAPRSSFAQDRGAASRGEQRLRSIDPVALAESIQLHQLYHSGSPTRQRILVPKTPPESIAQKQSRFPSGLPGLATNAENEGEQGGIHAPRRPISNTRSTRSDARYEGTDYTDVDPQAQTREQSMFGSEWQSGDADTNDEGSFVAERGRSRAPRGTGKGPLDTSLGVRREVERAYGYEAPSLYGKKYSAPPPRRDTAKSVSSYVHDAPYTNPLCQRELPGSIQLEIEKELYFPAQPLPEHGRDDHRDADAAELAPTVKCSRASSPQTSGSRQPNPLMTSSHIAPPQPVAPDRRQIMTARSTNEARDQPPDPAQTRLIRNSSYGRERSLSVSSFDRLPAQSSPTTSARLKRREDRGYNMNPQGSPMLGRTGSNRRPATHRNFPQPVAGKECYPTYRPSRIPGETQEPNTQYESLSRLQPLEVGLEELNARNVAILEEPVRPLHDGDCQTSYMEPGLEDWRTLIPQARQVLGRLGEFLSPELRDGLTRLAIGAAEAPYPADLARLAGPVGPLEFARQANRAASSRVKQAEQIRDNRRSTLGSSKAEGGDQAGKAAVPMTRRVDHTMAVKNVLNSPDQSQTQCQKEDANSGGAEGVPAPSGAPKSLGKRPPGRPRKDDPYRPEPRRKSVAPLPGEKPHVGRPKNVEIKTREQYHGGVLDYSTAVDTIKTVSKRTQFVATRANTHDQPNASVDTDVNQKSEATALNQLVPQQKLVTERPAVPRHVPRAAQQTIGETQTEICAAQPFTETIRRSDTQPTVVEERAVPSEDAGPNDQGVGVRGRFPGGTATYIYKDVPAEEGIQSSPKPATAATLGLRRSARTAIRQSIAYPRATASRPLPIPTPRNFNTVTSATRPLQRIEENVPSKTHADSRTDELVRGESQSLASLPPSDNSQPAIERSQQHHEQPTGMRRAKAHRLGSSGATLPTAQTRAGNPQQPIYVQDSVEDVHMTEYDAATEHGGRAEDLQDSQVSSLQQVEGRARQAATPGPATRSNVKRKSPVNSSISPKKQKGDLRRSPRDDKGAQDVYEGSQGV
ncbi:hypothetical protein L211DRAFT_846801 [Terfezia boudieri ATCC MYA-4762]|uniref:Uncharacterized protein n=1 Tax=Terfezia boudieri ATCC MYA-4762 TaxID=1051890 RepID=A0A3N4M1K2_9PEZI|nr:hypothetical protein L211DRAFT_846801 [Terfezia boudieri ATCC MYA-4762]